MARRHIGQRQARALAKRVAELEQIIQRQRSVWVEEWIGGTEIGRTRWDDAQAMIPTAIRTARRLGHAVVAVGGDDGTVRFVALPHAKEPI